MSAVPSAQGAPSAPLPPVPRCAPFMRHTLPEYVGLVLLTALSAFAAVSGVVVDFSSTHIYNPAWPPHAQFHGYLSIARTVLIMLVVIGLAWGPVRVGTPYAWHVLVALLFGWLGAWFIAPLVVPGTGDRAAFLFASVLTLLALIGAWLLRPPQRRG